MAPKSLRSNAEPLATAGTNKIKKRIRDLERLLARKRDTLPDTILIEKERSLDALRHELNQAHLKQKIRKNATKYHMVRFFERKKALRRYKQALKKNDADEILQSKIDLCYVVNFPKGEKYVAIFPNNEGDSTKTGQRRESFRAIVAKQLENGTLPVSLEDILQGKRLGNNGTGVAFDEDSEDEKEPLPKAEEEEEEEDEFFE
ncbi:ZYRO0D07326p [Zygosaccharomyces rouxii]|uniref:rRNA-processing protein EFG1 n=1 Tax=Zygosaccharomyces rouxii (strain ATCC 2623 / CBS 732 / NBRC 1130 / NCYC 568 / NRRL Y-229) TaxID=559307 RepID=C5DVK0_ZYGRC|nr:uncharacterized protein ZYRO0D07326g [Zygosaccharomyces rouxii]KAH9200731.1 hypothetical protein LQ764DRAFT_98198 [Zygosaccharomyces rouxii]CAR27819.1 ZYRO0D07326p [Zygosaccharomyces rouxii]